MPPHISLSPALIRDLILLYKSHPCLWQTSAPVYSDKLKRRKAFEELAELCRNEYQNADVDYIRSKIYDLRATYFREWRKVLATEHLSPEKRYVPKLWYYHLFTFLNDEKSLSGDVSTFKEKSIIAGSKDVNFTREGGEAHEVKQKTLERRIERTNFDDEKETSNKSSTNITSQANESDPSSSHLQKRQNLSNLEHTKSSVDIVLPKYYMSRKLLRELILAYKAHPYLWDKSSDEYLNYTKKNKVYEELVTLCKKYYVDVDAEYIKNKLRKMRSNCVKERQKVLTSNRYVSKLWYYSLFSFLPNEKVLAKSRKKKGKTTRKVIEKETNITKKKITLSSKESDNREKKTSTKKRKETADFEKKTQIKKTKTKIKEVDLMKEESNSMEADMVKEEDSSKDETDTNDEEWNNENEENEMDETDIKNAPQICFLNASSSNLEHKEQQNEQANSIFLKSEENMRMVTDSFSDDDDDADEFESIGRNVITKLKQMKADQRLIAEMLINRTLNKGLKNLLTENSIDCL